MAALGGGYGTSVAISPDGRRVFVTGEEGYNYRSAAYDAASGTLLWTATQWGSDGMGRGAALAVSPDGSKVFISGSQPGPTSTDYLVVAYESATGQEIWKANHDSKGRPDQVSSISISPDGTALYVLGSSGQEKSSDFQTLAFETRSGSLLWETGYDGPAEGMEVAMSMAMDPSGLTVYVTGESRGTGTAMDFATIAYNARTGKQSWLSRFNGAPSGNDRARHIAISPDGYALYVTGLSEHYRSNGIYGSYLFTGQATVSYDSTDGRQRWASGSQDYYFLDGFSDIAITPDGARVYVSAGGIYAGVTSGTSSDFVTTAYDSRSGAETWVGAYDNGYTDEPRSIVSSPDGSHIYVTGASWKNTSEWWGGFSMTTISYETGACGSAGYKDGVGTSLLGRIESFLPEDSESRSTSHLAGCIAAPLSI